MAPRCFTPRCSHRRACRRAGPRRTMPSCMIPGGTVDVDVYNVAGSRRAARRGGPTSSCFTQRFSPRRACRRAGPRYTMPSCMMPGRRRRRRCVRCRRGRSLAAAEHVVGAEPRANYVAAVHDVGVVRGGAVAAAGRIAGAFRAQFWNWPWQVFLTLFKSRQAKNKPLKLISILYVCGA